LRSGAAERARLLDLIGGSWRTQALHAMVELGVADRLADGPMQLAALAEAAHAHEGALHRLLRGLGVLGVVERCDEGYRLTVMGRLLRTEPEDESLAHWVRWWAGVQWTTWGLLHEAVRENVPTRARCQGARGYKLHEMHEGAAGTFHRAMAQLSTGVALKLVQRIAALEPTCIVDIGGGHAEVLAQLLLACPQAKGVLLEQDHALTGAREHLGRVGLLTRCELIAGNFFERVPEGADVYVLKSVLHNWDDVSAGRLLRTCRQAMAGRAILAVIERAIDEEVPDEEDVRSDLNMLVSLGGRERGPGELDALLRGAGFAPRGHVHLGAHSLILCDPG
jgi:orsellinic acid C2-O-methyltransferase